MISPALLSQDIGSYYFHIKTIDIHGNKVTKNSIILRELEFKTGDSLTVSDLISKVRQSENNLQNTFLFNFAIINYRIAGFDVMLTINLTERWYIWPGPILEVGQRNLPTWLKDPDLNELNYGAYLNWNNFRGRKELLQVKARFGYKQQFSMNYITSNLDKEKKHGLIIKLDKFRQHEIILRNENDKPVYFKTDSKFVHEYFSSQISYTFRPRLYTLQAFSVGYNKHQFEDDTFREEFLGISDGILNYFDLSYSIENDKRDYKIYPLHGYLLRGSIYQQGLGLLSLPYNKTYLFLIGSNTADLGKRFYLENAAKLRLTKDEILPNLFTRGIGYETYLRGFEYYTINGNSYFILINNLKYALLRPETFYLPAVPWRQFNKTHLAIYANLFFDAAYIDGSFIPYEENRLTNKVLWSVGTGIDLVSYYDQVVRLEFTLNSMGEPGIYLNLETPFRRW